ncbi:MAG: SDR family oxidoreductase [Bacteroidales bacterium]|jgi:short-subunit dehydrogenase|nr:SDR family oxidoreductase [Bacteroidales bacterium]
MKSLFQKVVVITGASSGIGEELAYAFAREKAIPVLIARNNEKLLAVKESCLKTTGACYVFPCDVTKIEKLDAVVAEIIAATGRIDILVNNAGMSQRSYAIDTPLGNDRMVMELNFFSKVAITKKILPQMIHQQSGHIVVISSIVGKFGFPMRSAYSASKHAVQGFFESLRVELMDDNIFVSIVSPGRIKTNISKNALTKDGSVYGIMDDGQANGMDAAVCAQKIIKAIKSNRKELLIGNKELMMVHIRRFLPFLYYRLVKNIKN